MPTRVIEVTVLGILTLLAVAFLFASSLLGAPTAREAVLVEEFRAKQLLLALDNLPATDPNLPPGTSVIDLLRLYYLSGRQEYLEMAERDIDHYAREMVDGVWRVRTADGRLDVKSPFFDHARVVGSASAPILRNTTLIVSAGRR